MKELKELKEIDKPEAAAPSPDGGKARKARLAAGAAAAVLGLAGFLYWLHARHFESTDDAFIEGHVTPLSPQVAGTVTAVHVIDNQDVKAGQLLAELDPRPFEVKLAEARAEAKAAEADALQARTDLDRARQLFRQDAVSKQALDHAVAAAEGADARLELARKRTAADELDLSYTRIAAPAAGRVSRKSVEPGSYVQVGQEIMALVPKEVWVVANFKETQLTDMRPGQPVTIHVDAFPDEDFPGKVDSIQSGTGSRFSLLPPENATGNYVKVVQRVPVKIVFDPFPEDDILLAPGMSVVPEVRVR